MFMVNNTMGDFKFLPSAFFITSMNTYIKMNYTLKASFFLESHLFFL